MADRPLVGLLGPVTICADGALEPVAGAPQRTVLARLALAAPRTVADAALVDALWPGAAPDNATGNLQSYVSRLRRQLGASVIVRESVGYRLAIDPDEVDAVRFEALVDAARSEVEPASAAAVLATALDLWRGDPFADLVEPLAFAPERARLHALHRRAVEEWLAARVDAGERSTVLPELQQAGAEDPTNEALHLLEMRVLHGLGRTPEALRVAADLRTRTIDRSGIEPSSAVGDLEHRILAGDPTLAGAPAPVATRPSRQAAAAPIGGRLAPADRFVGRSSELGAVAQAVHDHRVVTISGPGGAGKTRLVKELVDRGSIGPAVLVALASATASEIPARVAGALGLQTTNRDVEAALLEAGSTSEGTLILDNCEHVRDAARTFIEQLVATAPDVTVLTTSRVRIGVAGEKVVRLGPLEPDDQIELFCDRAKLSRADFVLAPEHRRLVESIGTQLDGLPLGLELAAGREAVFGLAQLEAQLSEAIDVVEPVDGDDRRSVTSTVEWSYALLSPDAQRLFDRIIFAPGGVTLDGLAHLWPAGSGSAMRPLSELVEASLVDADLGADPPRYRSLEVVRRVGAGHVDPAARLDAIEALRRWMQHHVDHLLELQAVRSPIAAVLVRREVDNLAATLVLEGDVDAIARLAVVTAIHITDQPQPELIDRLRDLEQAADGDDETAVMFALAAGTAAWLVGDSEVARPLLDRAYASFADGHPLRWVTNQFIVADAMYAGEVDVVEELTELILVDPHAPPYIRGTAVSCAALINLFAGREAEAVAWVDRERVLLDEVATVDGFVAYAYGELAAGSDPVEAARWFRLALDLSEAQGQLFNTAIASVGLAAVQVRSGSDAEGAAACAAAIRTTTRLGLWPQTWTTLRVTAELLFRLDREDLAGLVLAAGGADPRATEVLGPERARQTVLVDEITDRLGRASTEAVWARGRTMAGAEVADLVLGVLDQV